MPRPRPVPRPVPTPAPALALALGLALLPAGAAGPAAAASAQIGTWTPALYAWRGPPSPPPGPSPARRGLPAEAACVAAILDAEREAGIADHTLLAMGFTEAGRRTGQGLFTVWPWTVNAEGRPHHFATRDEAVAFVRAAQAQGMRSIDVGCLQVNLRWHPDAFPDLATAFDPAANARYAARFLTGLRRDHGTLDAAIGRYHSAQSELGDAYRQRVAGNRRWAAHAIGYLEALATGPRGGAPAQAADRAADRASTPAPAPAPAPAWTRAELGRLSFLSSLYADGPARPLLPDAAR